MTTNQAQREQWNSDVRVRNWPKRERVTMTITAPLIAKLAPQPGERVLDIGSGGGMAAIEAARAVGAGGGVTGFDISAGLVRLATRRAADASAANVRFISGDAQVDDMPGGPFDAVMSQFGVMFFADPVAAFRNIRRHVRPGGRMVFACWQPAAKNAWFPMPVLAKYAPGPPAPAAGGGPPPGPFAFGDVAYVRGILTGAGFGDLRHEAIEHDVVVPEDSMYERDIFDAMRLDAPRAEEAWKDLMAFVAPMRIGDGQVRMRLAPQLFTARSEE